MKRRKFIVNSSLAAAGILSSNVFPNIIQQKDYNTRRPETIARKFISKSVEAEIEKQKGLIKDREIAWMFENCFPNTLDTTVTHKTVDGKPDTFVITGDINAMWLRDSSAQVWPYLRVMKNDPELQNLIAGVINRQSKCILIDPYANAFNDGPGESQWKDDLTEMKPELHERKWEIDSLCYPIRLAHEYWKRTNDTTIFDENWIKACELIFRTFVQQQRKADRGPYKFQRVTGWQTDTVAGAGYGNPIKPVGLICSIFRPSDDATIYPFLIPSNFFAVKTLRQMAEIHYKVLKRDSFVLKCNILADEVESALNKFAISNHLDFGEMLAYEVDGFGNKLFMDDANVPSLLSMPYLGLIENNDPVYLSTRKFILSESNPYFFKGKYAEGIGGPHVGLDMIWPMSLIMRALTTDDDNEILYCLRTLKNTHAGTGFMHESFHKNDPSNFTRKWFAWANTLFGELILTVQDRFPKLLQNEI